MADICCIGHITLDKVVTPNSEVHMPGGTSFYFSSALSRLDINYQLVTAVAVSEEYIITSLEKKGIAVESLHSTHTVCFENIYQGNLDHRTQRVLEKADPFRMEQFLQIEASIYHLGPLLADDIPVEVVRYLAGKGSVSLDVQGYLRDVRNQEVCPIDWTEKDDILPYIDILKANEAEMEVLTGSANIYEGARLLNGMGVKEVVITLGSKGSVIYTSNTFYHIPAYTPAAIVDATGCGDTYMAGYLYKKAKGAGIQEAGEFAAAMATLKIAASGPFTGSLHDVEKLL